MNLSLIVAMDRNGLIGKQGGLPWPRINEDMRHFRELTMGKVVIVGRKTWDSLPSLQGRGVVVLCGPRSDGPSIAVRSAEMYNRDSVFVIGGAQTYASFRDHVTSAHVTLIDGEYEGDVYFPFPILDSPDWEPAAEPVTLAPGVVYHHMRRR